MQISYEMVSNAHVLQLTVPFKEVLMTSCYTCNHIKAFFQKYKSKTKKLPLIISEMKFLRSRVRR